MVARILVGADGSEPAKRATRLAAELAARCEAELHLVHVLHELRLSEDFLKFAETEHIGPKQEYLAIVARPGPERTGRPFPAIVVTRPMMETVAEAALRPAREAARAAGFPRPKEDVLTGDPAERLLDYAEASGIDLIVVGRRGLSAIGGLLMGSVSMKLCHHAKCPVLTVP